jgi:hypothetical protein
MASVRCKDAPLSESVSMQAFATNNILYAEISRYLAILKKRLPRRFAARNDEKNELENMKKT